MVASAATRTARAGMDFGKVIARRSDVAAALIALATLVVVLVQLDLMRRQTKVMERQDAIIQAQLAKAPRLELIAGIRRPGPSGSATIELLVKNDGTKGADHFYWELLVPEVLAGASRLKVSQRAMQASEHVTGSRGRFAVYRDLSRAPVHPGTTSVLGLLEVDSKAPPGEYVIGWVLSTEDGAFPADATKGGRSELRLIVGGQP